MQRLASAGHKSRDERARDCGRLHASRKRTESKQGTEWAPRNQTTRMSLLLTLRIASRPYAAISHPIRSPARNGITNSSSPLSVVNLNALSTTWPSPPALRSVTSSPARAGNP